MKKIPVIKLDMSQPPKERFAHVPKKLLKAGATLARRSNAEIGDKSLQRIAELVLDSATAFRNPYRGEIETWAQLISIRRQECLTSNFSYELSQAASWGAEKYEMVAPWARALRDEVSQLWSNVLKDLIIVKRSPLACTAGAAYYPKLGNVLVRSLDWDLAGLGCHSVIWNHTGLKVGDYCSVGWPGYVGALSANAAGRFAATINLAFPVSPPFIKGWPPSHLLRWVFENCHDYDDALATLRGTPVCFPAFVMLVGVKPGQAAVIELTPSENRSHKMRGRKPIAIANDYLSGNWRAKFDLPNQTLTPHATGEQAEHRRNRMLSRLNSRNPNSMRRALKVIQSDDWLNNECTMQIMVMAPSSGKLLVVGQEDTTPVAAGMVG